jgi:sortase (surface protein transpeptidase)
MRAVLFALCGWLWLAVAIGCQASGLMVVLPEQRIPPIPTPVAAPARLQIPRLGLDAPIEAVGQTDHGQMDGPQNPDHVAWYGLGATPGEPGNAVIAGHLDDPAEPAIFWDLPQLMVGDQVIVVDDMGVQHIFAVIESDRKRSLFSGSGPAR